MQRECRVFMSSRTRPLPCLRFQDTRRRPQALPRAPRRLRRRAARASPQPLDQQDFPLPQRRLARCSVYFYEKTFRATGLKQKTRIQPHSRSSFGPCKSAESTWLRPLSSLGLLPSSTATRSSIKPSKPRPTASPASRSEAAPAAHVEVIPRFVDGDRDPKDQMTSSSLKARAA